MLNDPKKNKSDKPFMNLSIDEMSARIQARDQALNRRNCLILSLFFVAFAFMVLFFAWYYSAWVGETFGALWQLAHSVWRLEWLAAGEILLQYKLSFFVLGLLAGFFLFLFITFQIGEMLIDLLWDWVSSLFN